MVQDTMKALSDPTRRKILEILKKGPQTPSELLKEFNMTGRTLSHHLSILKNADLISDVRKGTFIYYELNTSVVEEVLTWVASLIGDKDEK